MRVVTVGLAALFGLMFGSFANVVIYRVPKRESVVRPPSRCGNCGEQILARDNIPVVSWMLLRAKCRRCGVAISPRYPLVEALTATLFGLTASRLSGADLIAFLPLVWVLVVLSLIDIDHKLLPNRIVLPALASEAVLLGVSAALGRGAHAYLSALIGMVGAFGFFFALALISPRGMGMGDVKLSAMIGLALGFLGWEHVVVGLFLGFFAGAVGGIALIVIRRGGMKSTIPFGPYMALGAVLSVLYGGPIADAWLRR